MDKNLVKSVHFIKFLIMHSLLQATILFRCWKENVFLHFIGTFDIIFKFIVIVMLLLLLLQILFITVVIMILVICMEKFGLTCNYYQRKLFICTFLFFFFIYVYRCNRILMNILPIKKWHHVYQRELCVWNEELHENKYRNIFTYSYQYHNCNMPNEIYVT